MSQATDLIATLKGNLRDVERAVKAFERKAEPIGVYTDLAHLNIANIHLDQMLGKLAHYREIADAENPDTPPADDQADATVDVEQNTPPVPAVQGPGVASAASDDTQPETAPDTPAEPVQEPSPTAADDDPAAGLIAPTTEVPPAA